MPRFHGIEPSKNKKAKQQKKYAEEQAKLRAATSESTGSLDRLKQVQAASKTAYLVLDGTVRPGQVSDPASGYATSRKVVRLLTPSAALQSAWAGYSGMSSQVSALWGACSRQHPGFSRSRLDPVPSKNPDRRGLVTA